MGGAPARHLLLHLFLSVCRERERQVRARAGLLSVPPSPPAALAVDVDSRRSRHAHYRHGTPARGLYADGPTDEHSHASLPSGGRVDSRRGSSDEWARRDQEPWGAALLLADGLRHSAARWNRRSFA